jgi:hypothetical protein
MENTPDVKSFRDKRKHFSNTRLAIVIATAGLVILNIFQVRLCASCVQLSRRIVCVCVSQNNTMCERKLIREPLPKP